MKKIRTINLETIHKNKAALSDTMRAALYEVNEFIFSKLDYESDAIFLEPALFCYFLSDVNQKIPLEQVLYGYMPDAERPKSLTAISDGFGLVNLPNLGYIRTEPGSTVEVTPAFLRYNLLPDEFVPHSRIRLCLHATDHLAFQEGGVRFHEPPETSLKNHREELNRSVAFFQQYMSDFWEVVELCTREFVVFSSADYNSFAGIQQQGTAYFNIENTQKSAVFFIDDIAHQCGHVVFNILTLDTENYLKVSKDHPLSQYSPNPNEARGAYGAFHGLFTYSTILFSLSNFLENTPDPVLTHEALGRMGFYLQKFERDLKLMNNQEILTEKGLDFRKQFQEGYEYIYQKWQHKVHGFDYSNQPYIYQYHLFTKLNPLT
jgi:hypothetical protein